MLSGKDRLTSNLESKERLGSSLLLARLLNRSDNAGLFGEIVGIPFERYQLEPIHVQVDGQSIGLLGIMSEMDMIGNTNGVPHLSVGGYTTQESGLLRKERRTSFLEIDATRAYLVGEGLGVQGMGLVQYKNRENNEFGLGMPFVRNSGEMDIGGGVDGTLARFNEVHAHEQWLRSALYFGSPRFARFYGVFPYQTWMENEAGSTMQDTSLIVREDGRRLVPRKMLRDAILRLMPFVADEMLIPTSAFEVDGHNAFLRDNEVIFTDYETQGSMGLDYVNFMFALGNEWYFDELRKKFPYFCNLFGFYQTGDLYQADIQEIDKQVREKVVEANYRDDLLAPIFQHLIHEDRKAIERYAIAGLMASKACGRYLGRSMLKPFVDNMVNDPQYEQLSLNDVYSYVTDRPLEALHPQTNHLEEKVGIFRDDFDQTYFDIQLKTFGLPIEPRMLVPIDYSDILHCWPYDIDRPRKLVLPPSLADNPFEDVDREIISDSVYSKLASGFADMFGLDMYGITLNGERLNNYEYAKQHGAKKYIGSLPSLPGINSERIHILVEGHEDMSVELFPRQGKFNIVAENDIQIIPIAELNKLAYTIHTTIAWLSNKENQEGITFTISGIGSGS